MSINLGELYIQVGANTDALKSIVPVLKSLEATISKLDSTVIKFNDSLSKSFENVATKAVQSAQKITKSSENKTKAEETALRKMTLLHIQALEMNKKFDSQMAKTTEMKKTVDNYDVLSEGLLQVGTRAHGASNRLSGTTSKTRNLGLAAQNVGYQVQDMIVQFELGVEASRVLGQQLPQLLSGFGLWGTIAGTAAAGIAALIPLILSSGGASEAASKKIEKYNSALESSKSIVDSYEESQAKLDGTLSKFRLKKLRTEFEKLQRELKLFKPGLITGFTGKSDIEKRLFEISQAFTLARRDLDLAVENGIKSDINQTKSILAQTDAYNRGITTLREYEIQKKIIEGIENLGIQDNKEAIALLEERIRLQAQLADEEQFTKISREVEDFNTSLSNSKSLLKATIKYGVNVGEGIKRFNELAKSAREYERVLEDAGPVQARDRAAKMGITTAGLTNEEVYRKIAVAMANITQETKDATFATANLVEIQKSVSSLSDRIAGVKAGGGVFAQMFAPEVFKRASEFEKRTREIQRNLEFKTAAGDKNVVINSINEYKKIADEAGMVNPFEGIDPENTREVAEGIAKVEQSVSDLEQRAIKVTSAISQVTSQAASLFGQLSGMYAQQASYHKQMAEQALSYGRDQATLYMQLADAVHYSNNKQAKSFENRAIAAAEAAALQYETEKKAQAKSNALAKKAFENQKKLQIAQAIASTATAVVGQLSMQPVGPWNIALAAVMGALGAAQVAIIQKQQYTPRATGGSVSGSKQYLVGEEGPEIFAPGRSGTVLSQKAIMEGLANNRGGDTNINFTIQALDTQNAVQVLQENRGTIIGIINSAKQKEMRR